MGTNGGDGKSKEIKTEVERNLKKGDRTKLHAKENPKKWRSEDDEFINRFASGTSNYYI